MRDAWSASCAADYMGLWLAEPGRLNAAVNAIKAGQHKVTRDPEQFKAERSEKDERSLELGKREGMVSFLGSIAVLSLTDFLMKGWSKFGGTNTVFMRRLVRILAADEDTEGIILNVDSPGGSVAGVQELADDIRAANEAKPVFAHADDLAASAGYWLASQARFISANRKAEIGSIGVVGVIEDQSGKFEAEGIQVHVISTGEFKGMGVPGSEVTKKQLAHVQDLVDGIHEHFLDAVSAGRSMDREDLQKSADGRVFLAKEARKRGLIDAVQSLDETVAMLKSDIESRRDAEEKPSKAERAAVATRHSEEN